MPLERSLDNELRKVPGDYEREWIDVRNALDKHDEKVQERSWVGRIWYARADRLDRAELVKEVEHWREHADVAWDVARKLSLIIEREVDRWQNIRDQIVDARSRDVQELDRFDEALTRTATAAKLHLDHFGDALRRIDNALLEVRIDAADGQLGRSLHDLREILSDTRYQWAADRTQLTQINRSSDLVRERDREGNLREPERQLTPEATRELNPRERAYDRILGAARQLGDYDLER
jgi:hypothetical protein